MKIYGNEKLLALKLKIEDFQEKFVKELDIINAEYTPVYSKLKKERKDRLYLLGSMIFVFLILIFVTLLEAIYKYIYLMLTLYGIVTILLGLVLFIFIRVNKRFTKVKNIWNGNHDKIVVYKQQANLLLEQAKEEIFNTIYLTKYHDELEIYKLNHTDEEYDKYKNQLLYQTIEEIYLELGNTATDEDILNYYDIWGKKITSNNNEYNQFLDNRKRKAEIMSKDKE